MKRPNKEDYFYKVKTSIPKKHINVINDSDYITDLEKYCDELEGIVDSVGETNGRLARYIQVLEKALDFSLDYLAKKDEFIQATYAKLGFGYHSMDKEQWKKKILKEVQDE